MHRYATLLLACVMLFGVAHASRHELSNSLSIAVPAHGFNAESYSSITSTSFTTNDVKHLETLQHFTISTGGIHGDLSSHPFHSSSRHDLLSSVPHTRVNVDGVEVPHGTALHLSFNALGQEFNYHLEPLYGMISTNSKVEVHDENGVRETIPLKLQSYFLHTDDEWVSMTVHSDGTFSAVIRRSGEVYQVDPHHVHAEAMSSEHHYNTLAAASSHGMTVFRHSDLLSPEEGGQKHMCGAVSQEGVAAHERGENIQQSHIHTHHQRNLLAVDPFNCGQPVGTSGYSGVSAGQVVDYGMYLRAGSATANPAQATVQKATDYVQAVYAQMNAVTAPQLKLILQVANVQIETTPDQTNKVWNIRPRVPGQRCELANGAVRPTGATYSIQIDRTLEDFTAYVQTAKAGTNTFWHHMTNCYPPSGVVGIAYVNTMCTRLRTGVSTFSTTTWLTMAHEIAHNFGADHTFQLGQGRTGGIMDYGTNTFRGEVQFNIVYSRTQLCGGISALAADPQGVRRSQGGVQPYCFAALNTAPGLPTAPPAGPVAPTTAPATVRPTPPAGRTTYTLAQVAQHRTATDCWAVIGTNVYDITRWNVAGVHPAGPALITPRCGTDATTVFNNNHQNGASYLTQILARDVIGVVGAAQPPTTAPVVTPRPVPPVPTTAPATPPPNNPTNPTGIQYYWAVTPFSACSSTCEGVQTRIVVCVNGNNRNNLITVPDTFCNNGGALNGARPASSQACGGACPVRFVPVPGQQQGQCTGANGATCSTMAGIQGTLSQAVQCVKAQNGVNTVVADAVCITAGVAKPSTNTPCTLPACAGRNTWAFSAWSECSTQCGGGTQVRRVACVTVNTNAQGQVSLAIVQDNICQAQFGNPPASSRACNTQPCLSNSERFVWSVTSNFTECSAPCGGGVQTRTAYCTDTYMNQVVPGYQCPNAPIVSQGCNTQECGVYVWVTGRTGPCDKTCGPSTATRQVTCVNQRDPMMTPVSPNLCLQAEKPSETVPCQLAACPPGTSPQPVQPTPNQPSAGLAVYALNTVANHAIPSDCWIVVDNLVYNVSYFGRDPAVDGVSHPISGSYVNGNCGKDATIVFQQTHRDGTIQRPIIRSRLIGKIGANTPDPQFPPPVGAAAFKWQIDQVSIQCGPTPVDKCTVVSASTPRCVGVTALSLVPVDSIYCANQPNPALDPAQPRVGQACPVDANNPNPCVRRNTQGAKHHILSSILSSQQEVHPLTRIMHVSQAVSGPGPQWLAGVPNACTVMCGGGSQVRNVTCVDGATGATLPSTSCDPATKPDELLTCGAQPCPAVWVAGPWNECSEKCGGTGNQTRQVDCRSAASSMGVGMIQPDEACLLTAAKPSTTQTCNAFPCPKWVGGTWSACSEKCGMGIQSLEGVRCENQYGMVVDGSECVASSQYNHIRPCNMGPCPVYDHGAWSSCSATCGGGNQTREVYCRTKNHNKHEGAIEYNMTICDQYDGDGRAKGNHVTIQSCNEQACGEIKWEIKGKSPCDRTCGGGALRVTSVCMRRNADMTYSQVSDQLCLNSTMLPRPTEIEDCNTQPCANRYGWDPSEWGACSAYCGTGTQTREVTCIDLTTKTMTPGKCGPNTQYATTRACSEPVNKCWGNVLMGDMKTGECIVDPANPLRGTCQCRSGWAGSDCSINPGITNVYFENTKYANGVPVGANEKIIIKWNSYGANKDVSILIARDDNSTFFVQYIARNVVNTGVYEWNVGSTLDDLPFANKYVVMVMMKNSVFGRSAHFQTADPCQYKACGMNAVCQAGKCQCQPGYSGPNCEMSPCERLGCDSARSTCDNTASTPTCKCADGWTGPRCKTPVSCTSVTRCANGGDYQHPVDMPVSKPLTCPLDASDVTCDCQGLWTNTTCNVCGLKCQNGGSPNKDCTTCTCAPGFTGPTCACRYYAIKAKVNYDTSKWLASSLSTSTRRFQQTFANDIAASVIGLSANQIVFTSFQQTSANQQIDMEFQLTEQCGSIAPDVLMNLNSPRIAMAVSGGADTTGTLTDIYQQLLPQFNNTDSALLQGYLTSSIVPGSVVVNDPTSTVQPTQPGTPTDPYGPSPTNNGVYAKSGSSSPLSIMMISIIVGGIVGVVLIALTIMYCYKRSHASSQRTLNKVTTDQLPSGGTTSHSTTPRGAWEGQSTRA